MAATTTHRGDSLRKESTMDFSTVQAGLLPAGTLTAFGVIVRSTLTAYEMENGEFVAFRRVHGTPAPVMPLVVLR